MKTRADAEHRLLIRENAEKQALAGAEHRRKIRENLEIEEARKKQRKAKSLEEVINICYVSTLPYSALYVAQSETSQ